MASEAILRIERESLQEALAHLDQKSYQQVYAQYLADERKTERELALESGVSQNAFNKQKKKILKKLNFWLSNPKKFSNRK